MVGELYKSSMGWAIRFPVLKDKKTQDYGITIIPIENDIELTDNHLGKVVPFSVKVKSSKTGTGKMPYAKISLN